MCFRFSQLTCSMLPGQFHCHFCPFLQLAVKKAPSSNKIKYKKIAPGTHRYYEGYHQYLAVRCALSQPTGPGPVGCWAVAPEPGSGPQAKKRDVLYFPSQGCTGTRQSFRCEWHFPEQRKGAEGWGRATYRRGTHSTQVATEGMFSETQLWPQVPNIYVSVPFFRCLNPYRFPS